MRVSTPKFSTDTRYADWKVLVNRWLGTRDAGRFEPNEICNELFMAVTNPKAKREILQKSGQINSSEDLFRVLDVLFRAEVDPIGQLFVRWREFEQTLRGDEESISDYIDRVSFLMTQMAAEYNLVVPDPIAAYKLIEGARISDNTKQLVCAEIDEPTFANFADRLRKAFHFFSLPLVDGVIQCKQEPLGEESLARTCQNTMYFKKQTFCYICGDPKHFQYECPHNKCRYEKNHLQDYSWIPPEKTDMKHSSASTAVLTSAVNTPPQHQTVAFSSPSHAPLQQPAQQHTVVTSAHRQGSPNSPWMRNNSHHPVYSQPQNYQNHNYRGRGNGRGRSSGRTGYTPRQPMVQDASGYNQTYYEPAHVFSPGHNPGNPTYYGGPVHQTGHSRGLSQPGFQHNVNRPSVPDFYSGSTTYFGSSTDDISPMVRECLGHAMLDSGAGTTVVGKLWLKAYEDSVGEKTDSCADYKPIRFRFGDNEPVSSTDKVKIQAEFNSTPKLIEAYVVDCDVPLLLSRDTMKQLKLTIDFGKDELIMNNSEHIQGTRLTACGQYLIPIMTGKHYNQGMSIMLCHKLEKRDKALKLHQVFGHAGKEKIYNMYKEAKGEDHELRKELEELEKTCDVCLSMKRPYPRPRSCLPLSSNVNEVVAMDIKFINQKPVLHLIDTFSRFSACCFLRNKSAEAVVEAIFRIWISVIGRPTRSFFTDNGTEFNNETVRDMARMLEVGVKFTPIESPASNGICERHNQIIGEMSTKIIMDKKCSWAVALMWSVSAKNSLQNIYGYSPHQLMFGRNAALGSDDETKLVVANWDETTVSRVLQENLTAQQKAREEFIKAERKIRLDRALKSRVYRYMKDPVTAGDTVYFKRLNGKGLDGPGVVITTVDKNVIIKHCGKILRIHPSKVILKERMQQALRSPEPALNEGSATQQQNEENSNTSDYVETDHESDSESEADEDITQLRTAPVPRPRSIQDRSSQGVSQGITFATDDQELEITDDLVDMYVSPRYSQRNSPPLFQYNPVLSYNGGRFQDWSMEQDNSQQPYHLPSYRSLVQRGTLNEDPQNEDPQNEDLTDEDPRFTSTPAVPTPLPPTPSNRPTRSDIPVIHEETPSSSRTGVQPDLKDKLKVIFPKLKPNDTVRIKRIATDTWEEVSLVNRGGKATGKNKYHWNILDEDGNPDGVFFDKVLDFRKAEKSVKFQQSPDVIRRPNDPEDHPTVFTYYTIGPEQWKDQPVLNAMQEEINKWDDLGVYEEVDDHGQQPVIGSRWVVTGKPTEEDPNTVAIKARLVGKGFMENEKISESGILTNSPTAEKRSQRVMFNVAVHADWWINTLDIKSAFLRSKEIGRVLYLKPPKEVRKQGKIWLLKKPIYGLKDASRMWYLTLSEEMSNLGCTQSKLDRAVFIMADKRNNEMWGVGEFHIDDMLYAGTKAYHEHVIAGLKNAFDISKEGSGTFSYVGTDLYQPTTDVIEISQRTYINDIEVPTFVKKGRDRTGSLTQVETVSYRRLIGKMMWAATQTRPDILFSVIHLSTQNTSPTVGHLQAAIRLAEELKVTRNQIKIRIQKLGNIDKDPMVILCYTDARYNVQEDNLGTIGGHLILLSDGKDKCSPLSWHCSKIRKVCLSAKEAEAVALVNGIKEAIHVRKLISEMLHGTESELNIWIHALTDNLTLYKSYTNESQSQDMEARQNISWLKQKNEEERVHISWIASELQIADTLTRKNSNTRELFVQALQGELPLAREHWNQR